MTDIDAAITKIEQLAERAHEVRFVVPEERETYLTIDTDGKPTFTSARTLLAPYDRRPLRRRGTAALDQLGSFVAHAKRFRGPTSALFASRSDKAASIVAVYDYHDAGPEHPEQNDPTAAPSSGLARFCEHRAIYRFPVSEAFTAWTSPQKDLGQAAFAELIEDRIADLIDPKRAPSLVDLAAELGISLASPSRMIELSRGLAVRVASKVMQAVRLASGESTFSFASEHQDETGAPLKVPSGFAISIPVFERGENYALLCRLRYRVQQGSVLWSLAVHNAQKAHADAFEAACAYAAEQTGLPLLYGTPEP